MKILNKIYLVLALILGILGIAQSIHLRAIGVYPPAYLVAMLPCAVVALTYRLTRNSGRPFVHAILVMASLLACGFVAFMSFAVEFLHSGAEIIDVRQYPRILEDPSTKAYSHLLSHFPKTLPADARNTRFSYQPHFFQAGAHLQLRYALPPAKIADLYEHFAAKKTMSVRKGDTEGLDPDTDMPTTMFFTNDTRMDDLAQRREFTAFDALEFPEDYELMVLDPPIRKENRPIDWDHGQSHGVAISKKRSEIVYWMESW